MVSVAGERFLQAAGGGPPSLQVTEEGFEVLAVVPHGVVAVLPGFEPLSQLHDLKGTQSVVRRCWFVRMGPGSRRVSNGLNKIRRCTEVFGTKLRGDVGFVGCSLLGYRPQCHGAAMPQILYATSELRLWVSVFLDLYLNNIALSLLKP